MKLIVAVDKEWGIGKRNGLLFNIPDDMAFFKEKTMNKVVCMGYNTLLSFPNSKPLKNRVNIVLAPQGVKVEGATVVYSLEELSKELKKYKTDDIFIIGGGMFYRTMLPYCSDAYITEVDAVGNAEIFFENLSKLDNWVREELSSINEYEGLKFQFTCYHNKNILPF